MIELLICARRKKGMSKEAFHEYWRGTHGPLVKSVPEFMRHVRKYVQHHTLPTPVPGFPASTAEAYDGIAELWFDSPEAIARAFAEPRYLEVIRPDELKFVEHADCMAFLAEEVPMHGA